MDRELLLERILAEVLRLQRWAGGDTVSAAEIYGLANGFESARNQGVEASGVSQDQQEKVEELLEAIERGDKSPQPMVIKKWLAHARIAESTAKHVMLQCRLENRYGEAVEAIAKAKGSRFSTLLSWKPDESKWFGSLHYMELVELVDEGRKKLHAVFAAAVPRPGEIVQPENGSPMRVVDVEHVLSRQGDGESVSYSILVPHVLLEPVEDDG